MHLPLTIETSKQIIGTQALVDSGAEGLFINRRFARNNWINTNPLGHRIIARNVDNTVNKQGIIDHYADINVRIGDTVHKERFLVTDTGDSPLILGLPWLAKHNPRIDWNARQVDLSASSDPQTVQDVINPPVLQSIMIAAKSNTPMELAQKHAAEHQSEKPRTLEEMVPAEYHEYLSIFDKEKAKRYPQPGPTIMLSNYATTLSLGEEKSFLSRSRNRTP